jgi:hypothetical protein
MLRLAVHDDEIGLAVSVTSVTTMESGLTPTRKPPGTKDGSRFPAAPAPETKRASRPAEAARPAERRSLVWRRALGIGAELLAAESGDPSWFLTFTSTSRERENPPQHQSP